MGKFFEFQKIGEGIEKENEHVEYKADKGTSCRDYREAETNTCNEYGRYCFPYSVIFEQHVIEKRKFEHKTDGKNVFVSIATVYHRYFVWKICAVEIEVGAKAGNNINQSHRHCAIYHNTKEFCSVTEDRSDKKRS